MVAARRTQKQQLGLVRPVVGREVEHKRLNVLKLGEVGGKFELRIVSLWQGPLLVHKCSLDPYFTPKHRDSCGRDSCV